MHTQECATFFRMTRKEKRGVERQKKISNFFLPWKPSQSIKCIYLIYFLLTHQTTTTYHLFCSTIIIVMIIRATTVLLLLVLILCYTHGDKIITIMILSSSRRMAPLPQATLYTRYVSYILFLLLS